jgi:hypothetical protein
LIFNCHFALCQSSRPCHLLIWGCFWLSFMAAPFLVAFVVSDVSSYLLRHQALGSCGFSVEQNECTHDLHTSELVTFQETCFYHTTDTSVVPSALGGDSLPSAARSLQGLTSHRGPWPLLFMKQAQDTLDWLSKPELRMPPCSVHSHNGCRRNSEDAGMQGEHGGSHLLVVASSTSHGSHLMAAHSICKAP